MYLLLVLALLVASFSKASAQQVFTLEEAMTYAEQQAPAVKLALTDLAVAEGQIRETTALGIPTVSAGIDYTHFPEIAVQPVPDFITPQVFGAFTQGGVVDAAGQPIFNPFIGDPANGIAPISPSILPFQFGLKNTLQGTIRANALLFDATFFIALRGAKLFRNLSMRTLDQTAYQTRIQVTRAYLATLIAQRNIATIDRNVTNLERTIFETNALYEEGFVEKLSVDRLRLSLGNLEAQKESLRQVEAISKNLLKFQMGYPVTQEISLSTAFDEALGEARVTALIGDDEFSPAVRPEFATLQVADSLNALDLTRIKAGYLPSLTGFGNISRAYQRNNLFDGDEGDIIPSSAVGLSLKVPIYDGGTKKAQRQQALAKQDRTRIEIARFSESARLALANGRSAVINARRAVSLRETAIELAEEIYDVAQIKFREGVGSSLEVNQAQADLYAAQDALTQALYDLAVAFTDYQDANGEL